MRNSCDFSDEFYLRNSCDFFLYTHVIVDDRLVITEKIRALAGKPNKCGVRYRGYIINGIRFRTMRREAARLTQNSGV